MKAIFLLAVIAFFASSIVSLLPSVSAGSGVFYYASMVAFFSVGIVAGIIIGFNGKKVIN